VAVETRVVVYGLKAGQEVVVGEFTVRDAQEGGWVDLGAGSSVRGPQALTESACVRTTAYAKAMAAGVENTEARRLKRVVARKGTERPMEDGDVPVSGIPFGR
jgi:hypothetical protein